MEFEKLYDLALKTSKETLISNFDKAKNEKNFG